MKTLARFVAAGLVLAIPIEIENQIFFHKSVPGFFGSIIVYIVYLSVMYSIYKYMKPRVVAMYFISGLVGLAIEWFLLGNIGAAWFWQVAMFTSWGSFALVPIVFTERSCLTLRAKLLVFLPIWLCLIVIIGFVDAAWGMRVWLIGSFALNCLYIYEFRNSQNNRKEIR